MKTDVMEMHTFELSKNISRIIGETDKIADYNSLEKKNRMKLILIAEELVEAVTHPPRAGMAQFYVMNTGNEYTISITLIPDKMLYNEERRRIINISHSKENEFAKGISGRIREAAEMLIAECAEQKEYNSNNYSGLSRRYENVNERPVNGWSLSDFRSEAKKGTKEWDELEMSILAKVTDEITVGIMGGIIEIRAIKKF